MSKKKNKKKAQRGIDFTPPPFNGMPAEFWAGLQNMGQNQQGFLTSLKKNWGRRQTEQFILGAVLGAGAVYLLSDENTRSKVMHAGIKLYTSLIGGFEEIKEQMADIRAEIDANPAEL